MPLTPFYKKNIYTEKLNIKLISQDAINCACINFYNIQWKRKVEEECGFEDFVLYAKNNGKNTFRHLFLR